jgi:hypothetical protein
MRFGDEVFIVRRHQPVVPDLVHNAIWARGTVVIILDGDPRADQVLALGLFVSLLSPRDAVRTYAQAHAYTMS